MLNARLTKLMVKYGRKAPLRNNYKWCTRCGIVAVPKHGLNECLRLPVGEMCLNPVMRLTRIKALIFSALAMSSLLYYGWDIINGNGARRQWVVFLQDNQLSHVASFVREGFVSDTRIHHDQAEDVAPGLDKQNILFRKAVLLLRMSEIKERDLKEGLSLAAAADPPNHIIPSAQTKGLQLDDTEWSGEGATLVWKPMASLMGWDMYEPEEGTIQYGLRLDRSGTDSTSPIVPLVGWGQDDDGREGLWAVHGLVDTASGRAAWTEKRGKKYREVRAIVSKADDGGISLMRINISGTMTKATLDRVR